MFTNESRYLSIALTQSLSQGYAYLFFYGQFDPGVVNTDFYKKTGFGKYKFVTDTHVMPAQSLYVAQRTDKSNGRLMAQIKDRGGDVQYNIWEN